ncbi:MAG: DUF4382 domain-containing protein [Halorubrum sp.]|uniref:DUF4382 domain-containing protein n=1 Tax=Halorubrum sp. TaxID=1879286 RepID=UPI0039706183
MTDRPRTTGEDRSQDASAAGFRRREFVALGAGVSATMLAGCAGDGDLTSSDGSDGTDGSETLTGNFRLLISDAPADIGDFDQLNVTLDEARVFEAQDGDDEADDDEADDDEDAETEDEETDGEDDGSDQTGNETETESDSPNGTADEDDGEDDAENDGEDDAENDGEDDEDDEDTEGDRGFTVVDLDDATVDLTQVIDEDATAVFDGEIPAGSYEKVELSVTTVEGIVDGEEVDVKLPSEKLQITNGFEVTPDEPVSFVFDINVVKRGQNNGYILKPVISGSGVAGRDVEVNEIDDEGEDEDESDDADESDDEGDSDDGNETDGEESADEDDEDGATESETDDAENGTADGS